MKPISILALEKELENKLIEKNLNYVEDVWKLKRKDLKALGFANDEINDIIISLQLRGLDLNKKKY